MQEYVIGADIKRDNVARMLLHLTAPEQLAAEEEKRLNQRGLRLAAARERLGSYVLLVMRRFGHKRLEGELFTLRMHQNPPSVEIRDELLIPPEYLVEKPPPPPRIDKKGILDAIKAGKEVPGARLVTGRPAPGWSGVIGEAAPPQSTNHLRLLSRVARAIPMARAREEPGGGMRLHAWIDGE